MKIIKRLIKWLLYKSKYQQPVLNNECPHCKFVDNIFDSKIRDNRDYWLYTEIYVHLHNGKDYCDYKKINNG